MTAPVLTGLAEWAATEAVSMAMRQRVAVAGTAQDWLSALAAGMGEPEARRLQALPLSGTGAEAFRLGTISHLAEVDDGIGKALIHPGVVSLSPLFALAQHQAMTVAQLAAGIVAGYEAAARIGAALGKPHYRHFHITGTAGSMAAALAGAAAQGLDATGILNALGLGGTQAAGLWQVVDDGAEAAKAAHAGFAARNGIYAAELAKAGMAGPSRVLEGRRGLAAAGQTDLDTAPLLAPFSYETSGLMIRTVKPWPVCGQMFHVLDALLPLPPAPVKAVEIESFAALQDVAGVTNPQTVPQARFSTAFCVAHLLLRGRLDFGDLSVPGILDDPQITDLAARISLTEDPEMTAGYPARRAARITLTGTDGSRRDVMAEGRRGGPDNPLSAVELSRRFDRLTYNMPREWRDAASRMDELLRHAAPDTLLPPDMMERLCHAA